MDDTQTPAAPPAPQSGPSPRQRLQALLAVPERERTDAQWDEINELEIMLAPGNREGAPTPGLQHQEGNADASVKVSLDGMVVAERLTGGSVEVEPGEHTVRFERSDGKVIEQKVLVTEGEKHRKVVAEYASLVPKPPADGRPPPVEEKKIPLGSYVAGGVAVVALGSFAIFALTGKSNEDDLAGTCSPNCGTDEVGSVNRSYLVADVSLGVAAVATIVAVVLALPALGSPPSVKTAIAPAPWLPKSKTVIR
jgi:hypothetical protein